VALPFNLPDLGISANFFSDISLAFFTIHIELAVMVLYGLSGYSDKLFVEWKRFGSIKKILIIPY